MAGQLLGPRPDCRDRRRGEVASRKKAPGRTRKRTPGAGGTEAQRPSSHREKRREKSSTRSSMHFSTTEIDSIHNSLLLALPCICNRVPSCTQHNHHRPSPHHPHIHLHSPMVTVIPHQTHGRRRILYHNPVSHRAQHQTRRLAHDQDQRDRQRVVSLFTPATHTSCVSVFSASGTYTVGMLVEKSLGDDEECTARSCDEMSSRRRRNMDSDGKWR